MGRIDHTISDKETLFTKYLFADNNTLGGDPTVWGTPSRCGPKGIASSITTSSRRMSGSCAAT
jgi:hypothetical protein